MRRSDWSGGAVDVSRIDFRVARIISAERHPTASKLYVENGVFDFKFLIVCVYVYVTYVCMYV